MKVMNTRFGRRILKQESEPDSFVARNSRLLVGERLLLNALAHNLIVWSRRWLAQVSDWIGQLGILRMVRDIFHLNGLVHFYDDDNIHGSFSTKRIHLRRVSVLGCGPYWTPSKLTSIWTKSR